MINDILFQQALEAKALYKTGKINKKECMEMLNPYITKFNETSERLAIKYNQKAKKFSFASFMR